MEPLPLVAAGLPADLVGRRPDLRAAELRLKSVIERRCGRLYEGRYRAGTVALRVWLDAQERRRNADLALSSNQLAQLQNQVTPYQAPGGGFGR